MSLTIELPKDVEAALKTEAQAHGVTLEAWLQIIAAERVRPAGWPRRAQASPPTCPILFMRSAAPARGTGTCRARRALSRRR